MMIICKTPLRISFVGGGSDFEEFFQFYDGKVISASIDKYMYVSVKKSYKDIFLKYSKFEHVKKFDEIKHPIIKEVLKYYKLDNLDISSFSDIPGGSGLGSSSAFLISLINAINKLLKINISKKRLINLVNLIEFEKLKSNIGYQDQYACCYGGVNEIKFSKNYIKVKPLSINNNSLNRFNSHPFLVDTGLRRSAHKVLRLQKKNTINNIKYIFDLVKLCEYFKNELKNDNYRNCGKIINESWRIKKNLSKKITNNTIDDYIDLLFKNGIYGCKLLGAGMGGFILCLADPGNVEKIIKQNQNMRIVKFKFENKGTQLFSV